MPATPSVVLAQQLAEERLAAKGACACIGLLPLDQLVAAFDAYAIHCGVETLR